MGGCVSRRSAQRLCAVPLDGFGCELMRLYSAQSRKLRNHKLEKATNQDYGERKCVSASYRVPQFTEKIHFNDNNCEELTRNKNYGNTLDEEVRRGGGEEVRR